MNLFLAIILGAALAVWGYETYNEREGKKVDKLLAPDLKKLTEISSLEISKRRKQLSRDLTDEEKNKIFKESYKELYEQ